MKVIKILILSMLLVITMLGCEETDTLKIGVVGTMSGGNSDLAISGRRGVELFIDEVNDRGGINGQRVELVIKDDENNPAKAAEIVKEFEVENIEIVIGHYTSGMMIAAYQNLIQSELLYLAPTVSADSLNEVDDNLIRFIASTKEQGIVLGALAERLQHQNIAMIIDNKNLAFNNALRDNFVNEIEKFGGKLVLNRNYDALDQNTIDLMCNEIKEKESEIDAVLILANATDLATIDQTLHIMKTDVVTYGPLWSHTNDLLRLGGISVEGDYFVSAIELDNTSDTFKAFRSSYMKRYGEEVTFSAMYSYEVMIALEAAARKVKSTQWEDIKSAIIDIQSFEGLQGKFEIDEYGDNTRQYLIDQIVKGEFKRTYED